MSDDHEALDDSQWFTSLDLHPRVQASTQQRLYAVPTSVELRTLNEGRRVLRYDYQESAAPVADPEAEDFDEAEDPVLPDPLESPAEGGQLAAFIRLHDAENDPDRIVQYARRFGVLGLCGHQVARPGDWLDGIPVVWRRGFSECDECVVEHELAPSVVRSIRQMPDRGKEYLLETRLPLETTRHSLPAHPADLYAPEPIDVWLDLSARLRALLTIVSSAQRNEMPRLQDVWLAQSGRADPRRYRPERWPTGDLDQHSGYFREEVRHAIQQSVQNFVVEQADVRLRLPVANDGMYVRPLLVGRDLLGTLALQLLEAVCVPASAYLCDFCGSPFIVDRVTRRRRPREDGAKHYCPECRRSNYLAIKRSQARERHHRKNPDARKRKSRYDLDHPTTESEDSSLTGI
jgi:ssDNA-binding Zn-finger/Zn-ribbon topoisomerase 1